MAVYLSPVGGAGAQFFDNNGVPLTGGKLYSYEAGTTTPQPTYTTSAGNVARSNPIVLDSAGRVPSGGEIWLTDGLQYKFVLKDSNDVLIATYDNITGINSNFVNYTNQQEIQTATAGQTVFTLTTMQYLPGTGSLSVFVDGVNQYGPGAQYAFVETSATTVTFNNGLHFGASVKFTTSQVNAASYGTASQISYTPGGANAIPTNVQDKLRQYISVQDFGAVGDGIVDDSTAFTNAWAAANPEAPFVPKGTYKVTGTITGNFYSVGQVTITNGTANVVDVTQSVATSNRAAVRYDTTTSVAISAPQNILMGGFRFFGQYTKARAPAFPRLGSGQRTVSLTADLGAESVAHLNGWYAVFGCADNTDSAASFKLMPFLRVGSVAGSIITLCSAAEGVHSASSTTYSWSSTNNLANTDCLVISETVSGRANAFSGRVTTITANNSTTITLSTIGAVATLDWILPAPPGFDQYCYLGAFYYETPGDVRNIADSGQLVKAKMINTADPNWSDTGAVGSLGSPVALRFGGYISPLATAVIVKETASFSTASLGSYAAYYDIDGSQHIVQTNYGQKEGTPTDTMVFDGVTIPFCFSQAFYYSNTGSIIAQRSGGTLEITGWYEL